MSRVRVAAILVVLAACADRSGNSSDAAIPQAEPSGAETALSAPAPRTGDVVASSTTSLRSTSDPDADQRAIVLAAAIARVTVDNSFGGAAVFDHVNIVERLGTATADGFVDIDTNSPLIDAETRTGIERTLAPTTVAWVTSRAAVIGTGQDLPTYEDVGAVLQLGGPQIDGDQATITSGLWCGDTCGEGGTHELERGRGGGWQVTGTIGPQWMS